jgi:hypothetical protein
MYVLSRLYKTANTSITLCWEKLMNKYIHCILPIAFMINGCASTSPITQYGKDTFIVSASDSMGGYSSGSLQVRAAQEANKYCAQMGKQMVVRNTNNEGVQMWTGTSSGLIFSCISENDPEYVRPTLRKEANTVIEDRRNK